MTKELLLIWENPNNRRKYTIGKIAKNEDKYVFNYAGKDINLALNDGFDYFPGFKDLDETYYSEQMLFSNIASRLPNKKREDYLDILNAYDLSVSSDDFEILEKTRGMCITDTFEFVKPFDRNDCEFEVAGTSHSVDFKNECSNMKVGDNLKLVIDKDNKYDGNAVAVIFENKKKEYHIGYVPRYYAFNAKELIENSVKYSLVVKSKKDNFKNKTILVRLIFEKN